MIPFWILIIALCIVIGALIMTLVNLRFFPRSDRAAQITAANAPLVSVCIPARNEQDNLQPCVQAVLESDLPALRVLVYDDQSADATPKILDDLIAADPRVQRIATRPLPDGWVGKQWACWQLGQAADTEYLLFIDADVRLTPDALRRAIARAGELDAALLSTFPRQITGSPLEALVIPLIHFILLSYLPFGRMRRSRDPAASAACGQFMLFRREDYLTVGGHSACRDSMHDGVKLPRVLRRAGRHTDLFDGTDIASCRMYRGALATWRGFAKNAYEGLGSPALLIFITLLHAVGHILPWIVLAWTIVAGRIPSIEFGLSLACVLVMLAQRLILAARFRQSYLSGLLHPIGVAIMTLIQWHSFVLSLTGRRGWRGRTLAARPSTPAHAPDAPA